ncbi:hypothetical protein HIM_01304 [Hirsutella minnesotensis 3608]|nr:hypothetical protein HIM_01304 [Hirsutella minnesotensis 3608]
MRLSTAVASPFAASSIQATISSPPSAVRAEAHSNPDNSRAARPLAFEADDTFQISIFEDLHFGENAWDSWGPQQDINSLKVMDNVLNRESPGLVVLNGDLITGENTFFENSTHYVDQIVGPMLQRNLPWASTYGNHDYDRNISGASIMARENRWPNSRTQAMVMSSDAGYSNYYLPVYPATCKVDPCPPELLLWFFDSRGGNYFQQRNFDGTNRPQPSWVHLSVVDWFQKTSAELGAKYRRIIPSLAFVHIPTYASRAIQIEKGRESVDPHLQPGINDDYPMSSQAQGWCPDGRSDSSCDYGGQDIPFMQAISSTPGLIALFSGHDHGNTWCYKWDRLVPGMTVAGNGVNLCFGQRSGYGGYGNWIRGARQIRLHREALQKLLEIETWIRLENGDVVGAVELNATYGTDRYPATPNDKTKCPTCSYPTDHHAGGKG